MWSVPSRMRVSLPRMALPGRGLTFWAMQTMRGSSARARDELGPARDLAPGRDDGEHRLVALPAHTQDGVAEEAAPPVLVVCRDAQALRRRGDPFRIARDPSASTMQDPTGTMAYRSAREEPAADRAAGPGREGRQRLVPERAWSRGWPRYLHRSRPCRRWGPRSHPSGCVR